MKIPEYLLGFIDFAEVSAATPLLMLLPKLEKLKLPALCLRRLDLHLAAVEEYLTKTAKSSKLKF